MKNVIFLEDKFLSLKPVITQAQLEYKKCIEDIIKNCQEQISSLQETYEEVFNSNELPIILKLKVRVDPKELENTILQIIDKKPNLLTKEIHQEIISSGLQVIEETVRRKLEDLLKKDRIEKTDLNTRRNVRYKIKLAS
jgi:hypothetical protein